MSIKRRAFSISDTIHEHILMTDFEKRVLSTAFFNRLHDVYQNSTVYLTFPTNQTKRFEHSVGTLDVAGKMFLFAVANSESGTLEAFFNLFKRAIRDICRSVYEHSHTYEHLFDGMTTFIRTSLDSADFIPNLDTGNSEHAFFTMLPANIKASDVNVYFLLLQAVRLSALLHDIGHPPFSHIVENSLKILLREQLTIPEQDRTPRGNEFVRICSGIELNDEKHQLHEEMGILITDELFRTIIRGVNSGVPCQVVLYEVVIWQMVMMIFRDQETFGIMHSLVDGTLDADRLDYITRDPMNSGLQAGSIEYHRIFGGLCILPDGDKFGFFPSVKSLNTIEDMLNRRWRVYKHIIYHHHVIKTDSILEKAVIELGKEFLSDKAPCASTSATLLLPNDISGLWISLSFKGSRDVKNAISQWDDSWLVTTLKRYYFQKYHQLSEDTVGYKLSQKLAEILTNEKCYISLIKRSEDFMFIDHAVFKCLLTYREDYLGLKESLSKESEKLEGEAGAGSEAKLTTSIPINATFEKLDEFFLSKSYSVATMSGFILCRVLRYVRFEKGRVTEQEVLDEVSSFLVDYVKISRPSILLDAFAVKKRQKESASITFYQGEKSQPKFYDLSEISCVQQSILNDWDYYPYFFIYALLKQRSKDEMINREELFEMLGKKLGEFIWTEVKQDITNMINRQKR